MADAYLMEADCRHGRVWFECQECSRGPECPDCADKDAEIERLRAENERLQALIDAAAPLLVYYGDGRSVAADDVRIVDALLAAATKDDDRG